MKIAPYSIAVISSVSFALAEPSPTKIAKLTTLNGTTYIDVTVSEVDVTGLHIMHSSGAATIPWAQVSPEIRVSVGYDPHKLAEAAKKLQLAARAQEPKARIGATPDEFRRAGCAYIGQSQGPLDTTVMEFQRRNYIISATFLGGYCHELMVMDSVMVDAPGSADLIMEGKELTGAYNAFVRTVLESNAGEAHWKESRPLTHSAREWTRTDGQITARYIDGGRFTLITKQFSDALSAAKQKKEKKSLEGF